MNFHFCMENRFAMKRGVTASPPIPPGWVNDLEGAEGYLGPGPLWEL